MHYKCEVVLPAGTENIEEAIGQVMKRFDESDSEATCPFWDYWTIGGRYAGDKQMAKYDQTKLQEFWDWLTAEKITVSSIVAGKQTLHPASQQEKVDAKWTEMFGGGESGVIVKCPIFSHSSNQYGRGVEETALDGDIMKLSECLNVTCYRVIFAAPSHDGNSLEAAFMLANDAWNGVNHMPVTWDGTIGQALELFKKRMEHMAEAYISRVSPTDDSIVVTVDYHS